MWHGQGFENNINKCANISIKHHQLTQTWGWKLKMGLDQYMPIPYSHYKFFKKNKGQTFMPYKFD